MSPIVVEIASQKNGFRALSLAVLWRFWVLGLPRRCDDLRDLGWYIAQHDRLIAHWRQVLPNPITTMQLNDWVQDFDAAVRRVLHFFDLPYGPARERFHEQDTRVRTFSCAQVRYPVNARGLGFWDAFKQHLQPLIDELVAVGGLPAGRNAVRTLPEWAASGSAGALPS